MQTRDTTHHDVIQQGQIKFIGWDIKKPYLRDYDSHSGDIPMPLQNRMSTGKEKSGWRNQNCQKTAIGNKNNERFFAHIYLPISIDINYIVKQQWFALHD